MANRLGRLFSWVPLANELGFQIIVICNSCIDQTKTEIEKFVLENKLTNVKVLENSEIGPGIARNYGLKYAVREFTVFWDSDDVGNPINLLRTLRELEGVDALIARYSVVTSSAKKITNLTSSNSRNNISNFSRNPGIWRCIFRTSSIQNVHFGSSRMGEDQTFIAEFLTSNPRIEFTELEIYQYFIGNPDQLTSNKKNIAGLIESSAEISRLLEITPAKYLYVTATFYLRQCLTGIKKGEIQVKVVMILNLLRLIFGLEGSGISSRRILKILKREILEA
jgi:glycosyltransferase involved in cell wall biosynthesis